MAEVLICLCCFLSDAVAGLIFKTNILAPKSFYGKASYRPYIIFGFALTCLPKLRFVIYG